MQRCSMLSARMHLPFTAMIHAQPPHVTHAVVGAGEPCHGIQSCIHARPPHAMCGWLVRWAGTPCRIILAHGLGVSGLERRALTPKPITPLIPLPPPPQPPPIPAAQPPADLLPRVLHAQGCGGGPADGRDVREVPRRPVGELQGAVTGAMHAHARRCQRKPCFRACLPVDARTMAVRRYWAGARTPSPPARGAPSSLGVGTVRSRRPVLAPEGREGGKAAMHLCAAAGLGKAQQQQQQQQQMERVWKRATPHTWRRAAA